MADEKRQESGGRSLFVRVAALILALLVVFGAVSVALLADNKYLDRVRRWLVYGDSTKENLYTFAADSRNRYGQSGDYLVVLSQNTIQFLENDGTAYLSQQVQLSQPALSVGGNLAAAYDVGGQNLYLFSRDGERLHLTLEEGCGFISARLNENGCLAVVHVDGATRGLWTSTTPGRRRCSPTTPPPASSLMRRFPAAAPQRRGLAWGWPPVASATR